MWRMASGAAVNKALGQNRFVCTRLTFNQSLMVSNGTLKLDYACDAQGLDLVVHTVAILAQSTRSTLVHSIRVSQNWGKVQKFHMP